MRSQHKQMTTFEKKVGQGEESVWSFSGEHQARHVMGSLHGQRTHGTVFRRAGFGRLLGMVHGHTLGRLGRRDVCQSRIER